MAKQRSLNDTVFGIHGINPSFTSRDEQNTNSTPKTTGKIILKRQQLLACPYLQVDEQIKLLNLQKNCIVKIANLDHLTSLVVLDLCENEIDSIQGLDCLLSLRILRLANNKIRQIKNLDALKQLDVLDLNGNQISRIENCKQLVSLRVLNLAFNRIERCENLKGLQNLVELNLQGNLVTVVNDLETLPIQRLNLSSNKIRRFDDIRCVSKLTSLEQLSLEGNPLPFTAAYEQIILTQSQTSTNKQDARQPMNRDQRINRALRMQNPHPDGLTIPRDRRFNDVMTLQQDSMSERSDNDFDSASLLKANGAPPPAALPHRNIVSNNQPRVHNRTIPESTNPLFVEPKLNPIIHERTTLAKNLVQSALDDAFRKETLTIQLERYWPLILKRLTDH